MPPRLPFWVGRVLREHHGRFCAEAVEEPRCGRALKGLGLDTGRGEGAVSEPGGAHAPGPLPLIHDGRSACAARETKVP